MMLNAALANYVKEHNYINYLSCIIAPDNVRNDVLSLYAFNIELSKIAFVTSETSTALIRLQWWRDTVFDIYTGKIRQHFIVKPLSVAIKRHDLKQDLFHTIIDAHEFDAYDHMHQTFAELREYANNTESLIRMIAANMLGQQNNLLQEISVDLAIAECLIQDLIMINQNKLKNISMPQILLNKFDIMSLHQISNHEQQKFVKLVKYLCMLIEDKINFKLSELNQNIRLIYLQKLLIKECLKSIKRNKYNILTKQIRYNRFMLVAKVYLYSFIFNSL